MLAVIINRDVTQTLVKLFGILIIMLVFLPMPFYEFSMVVTFSCSENYNYDMYIFFTFVIVINMTESYFKMPEKKPPLNYTRETCILKEDI